MNSSSDVEFGSFRLSSAHRTLLRDGVPIKLGSRAFDLLVALVDGRDGILDKQQMLDAAWPGRVVEEANLAVQVQALRKVLGRAAITTVAGRGYRFTLPVRDASSPPVAHDTGAATHGTNLPRHQAHLYGREQDQQQLLAMVRANRLVTLTGTGGVGKTRLAQRVALDLLPFFSEGVWWVELAALSDAELVPASVARVLRITPGPHRDAVSAVAAALRAGPALLVLDNAEHLLDGVLALVHGLQQAAPQAHLLVTSQDPLRVPDERVLRLAPLSLPADRSLDGTRGSGAAALFEARARSLDATFELHDGNHGVVSDICRQLDGIPLALELAAARLPLLGLEGLRSRLDERLKVLTHHARATLPRHKTLRAALTWSHALLDAHEQRVFRRLGVFVGGFTLESAQLVAQDEALDDWAVLSCLGTLVDKSLVLAVGEGAVRYRLLETTRLFALECLAAAGEHAATMARHARALDALLTVTREDKRLWRTAPAPVATLVAEVDNARAALDWARQGADSALAVSLAAGSSHAFLAASLNAEYLQRVLPLRERVQADLPAALAGLFWARLALACSRNAHPAGLDAGLRAAELYRALGDPGRLYDALTWTIAIGARLGQAVPLQPLVDEAERLEQAHWPPAVRSSFQWAKHRWLQLQNRSEEALSCARAQAELLAQDGHWAVHVAWGANVADCELSLGRLEQAEVLARTSLQALDALGIDENLVGHVLDMRMVTLVLQGRHAEAVPVARRARRLLEREGDDLRLLDSLALNAATQQRWAAAARIAGHADAAMARNGETRWPTAAARRQHLDQRLQGHFAPAPLAQHLRAGASLSREEAFSLAFAEAASTGA